MASSSKMIRNIHRAGMMRLKPISMVCSMNSSSSLELVVNKQINFGTGHISRKFSSLPGKDDIFVSINHSEKIKTNDSDTKKLLNPLQEDDHDHDHSHEHVHVDDDGMEQEEMFIQPDVSLGTDKVEWGGPRRGGRFSEPTRFGDWERKGRCTDF